MSPLAPRVRTLNAAALGNESAFRQKDRCLHGDFVEGLGVMVDLGQRQLLAQRIALATAAHDVNLRRSRSAAKPLRVPARPLLKPAVSREPERERGGISSTRAV